MDKVHGKGNDLPALLQISFEFPIMEMTGDIIDFNDTLQACDELHADQNLSLKSDESLCGLGVNGEHSCYVRKMFSINFPIRLFSIYRI